MRSFKFGLASVLSLFFLLLAMGLQAQVTGRKQALTQQDGRVHVEMFYQQSNDAIGDLTQDYRITVKNKTNDKLHVYITYYADLVCGCAGGE